MSAGEVKFDQEDCVKSCGIIKAQQSHDKCSFIVTVDENGKVEVGPNSQSQQNNSQQIRNETRSETRKAARGGKQRIRIALIEEDIHGSSDDDVDEDKSDMISIDAQSFEAMHDRFVKIYNKNLRGKPSFVVLEDALVRKRIEDTLQEHCSHRTGTCHHCNAQQQTSSCDIGAHTGSQTDEFLLQCALRSKSMKGQSRGCQVSTDVNFELPSCNCRNCNAATSKKNVHLSALQFPNVSNPPQTAAAGATSTDSAPRVTISITPQNVQPQQASNFHPCNCNCNNCCPPTISHSNHCLPATDNIYACSFQPQHQQQHQQPPVRQQQYQCNCCSSCCLLRPTVAQTSLGFGHSPHIVQTPSAAFLQQQQHQTHNYPYTSWPPQTINPCLCCPVPFGMPPFSGCQLQMPQHYAACYNDQQQQRVSSDSSLGGHNFCPHPNHSTKSEPQILPEMQVRRERSKKYKHKSEEQADLQSRVSQVTVRRLNPPDTEEKITKKTSERNKAGATPASNKVYMARFGRTCLILKPTTSPASSSVLSKRRIRSASVMALTQEIPTN